MMIMWMYKHSLYIQAVRFTSGSESDREGVVDSSTSTPSREDADVRGREVEEEDCRSRLIGEIQKASSLTRMIIIA